MKKAFLSVLVLVGATVLFSACSVDTTTAGSSNQTQSKKLEENQKKLIEAVPVPQVEQSSDRKSIAARAERFADENKVSYVYLVSYGKVMAFYPIKGKVVSIRSYMTPQEQIVNENGRPCPETDCSSAYGDTGYIVQAPDIDGTYGDNADSVFFFTTEGAYVEWKGEYMVSDQPLKLSTQPELVREIK